MFKDTTMVDDDGLSLSAQSLKAILKRKMQTIAE